MLQEREGIDGTGGALLVSEDTNGVIYRISHQGRARQAEARD